MTATWAGGNHGRCAAQPGAALRAAPGRLGGRHVDSIWPLCLISRRARQGLGDRLDNLKHGECCDSVSNERAKYAPALQLLDHGQLHIGLHLQDGSYHTDRPMISGASRSPWLQKGATDGRSQAASWKIRLVRARRRMPRRPRRSTARCWGWKVQPFPMGDSTYEMIYAPSGAPRVIPPTRWRPAVAGAWNELHTSDPKKALAFYE